MSAAALPAARARRTLLAAGLLAAAGLAAYHNSFRGPFIYDDVPAILDNPSIRHLWPPWVALLPPQGAGMTAEGRPVLNFSFAINYAISGRATWSYHALNLAIHLLAGMALFGTVRRTLARTRPDLADFVGFSAALLWLVHPLQTEAVTYVVQRAESLMGLFYLATIYCFIRGADSEGPTGARESRPCPSPGAGGTRELRWLFLSWLCCLAGMGTKEVMVTAPVMVLCFDRTFLSGGFIAAWRRRRGYYLALAATWIPLGLLVAGTGGNRSGSAGFGTGIPFSAYALTQAKAIATYLKLSVWPHPLVFEYGTFWTSPLQALPCALVVLALGAATLWALVRKPSFGFLGFWFFGLLAPTSLTPGTTQMIVEHRMYLPLAAVTVLFAVAVAGLARRPRALFATAAFGPATGRR